MDATLIIKRQNKHGYSYFETTCVWPSYLKIIG